MANNGHFLLHILVYIQAVYTVSSQLMILEPQTLANQFPGRKVTGSTAAFGTPVYDEVILGVLEFFDTTGCEETDYHLTKPDAGPHSEDHNENDHSDNDHKENVDVLRKIVMLRRGTCHFVNKVVNAEKKGATAVIVVDTKGSRSTAEVVSKIIMADDGWGDGVKIPSLLIGEVDGNKLIEALKNETVLVELAWSLPKSTPVKVDQWLSPSFQDTNNFLVQFAPYAKKLKHKLVYRPHYVILSLPGNFKAMCSDDTGMFCAWDPDKGGKTTGKQIVEETVRQICLWEVSQELNEADINAGFYSEKWWNYVERFPNECPHRGSDDNVEFYGRDEAYISSHTTGEQCSYSLMKDIGASVNEVRKCYKNSFESILNHEVNNKAWSLDAITINGWRYSGPLDAVHVARTLCTGFHVQPNECVDLLYSSSQVDIPTGAKNRDDYRGVFGSNLPLWSLIVISCVSAFIILVVIGLLYWCCIRKRIRRSLRYTIMDEVRKEVSVYNDGNLNKNLVATTSSSHDDDDAGNGCKVQDPPVRSTSTSSTIDGPPLPPFINMTNACCISTAATPLGRQFQDNSFYMTLPNTKDSV